jgi:hypothetical protein
LQSGGISSHDEEDIYINIDKEEEDDFIVADE